MSETRIECPSGLVVLARGFKTKEANLLADKRVQKAGTMEDQILANCTLSVVEPGPYTLGEGGKLDWSKVHVGDRLYAILRIRAATYGEDYDFNVVCDEDRCHEPISWHLELKDLPVKLLPPEAREAMQRGDRTLTVKFQDRTIRFRLLVGEDEAAGRKLLRNHQGDVITTALLHRITAVSEVVPNDRGRWIDNLEMEDTLALRDLMDSMDGGVNTDIIVVCPACGARQEIRLPFGAEFFMPTKRRVRAPTPPAAPTPTPTSG